VRGQNRQRAIAHQVANIADDSQLLPGKTRNAAQVPQVLRVAVSDGTRDAVFDAGGQVLDRAVDERGALRVATDRQDAGWAATGGVAEGILKLADAEEVGAADVEICGEEGGVVNAFDCDAAVAEDAFESFAGWGADCGALCSGLAGGWRR